MPAAAHPVLDGRFRIDDVLRSTAGRRLATGTDLSTGARVTIESAPEEAVSPGTLMRLEHARRAVGETPTESIAPVLGVGREDGAIHLVTARPEGESLRALRGQQMPVADALAVGVDVLGALAELHVRGVLHRDVTPAAITVTREEGVRATLTAVGLAADAALLGPIADVPAEEVEHLAPEASGVLPGGVDERSDLYSAGALIYLLVAGRPPVAAPTAAELLRDTLTATVPSLRTVAGDTPAGISLLRALRRIGVRVAVDDFGSGYSSLGQLRRLPVDLLKIDRVFLADAGSPEATSFLRAIVELARGLGLGVVAEGIEDEEQLTLVREVRCGLGQGWLWARAIPLDALRVWLRDEARDRDVPGSPSDARS